jgi:hypothetical protein
VGIKLNHELKLPQQSLVSERFMVRFFHIPFSRLRHGLTRALPFARYQNTCWHRLCASVIAGIGLLGTTHCALGAKYDRSFPALPIKTKYSLVYAADSKVCAQVQQGLAEYEGGKRPRVYSKITWKPVENAQVGSAAAWGVELPWQGGSGKDSKQGLSKRLHAMKQYFALREDGQDQSLTMLVSDSTEAISQNDLENRGVVFDGGALYSLRAITPNRFPVKYFGVIDERLEEDGIEQTYADFFDLINVNSQIYVTFRSHNVFDLRIAESYREWFVVAALPEVFPEQRWPELNSVLRDVCYFVRRK